MSQIKRSVRKDYIVRTGVFRHWIRSQGDTTLMFVSSVNRRAAVLTRFSNRRPKLTAPYPVLPDAGGASGWCCLKRETFEFML